MRVHATKVTRSVGPGDGKISIPPMGQYIGIYLRNYIHMQDICLRCPIKSTVLEVALQESFLNEINSL